MKQVRVQNENVFGSCLLSHVLYVNKVSFVVPVEIQFLPRKRNYVSGDKSTLVAKQYGESLLVVTQLDYQPHLIVIRVPFGGFEGLG